MRPNEQSSQLAGIAITLLSHCIYVYMTWTKRPDLAWPTQLDIDIHILTMVRKDSNRVQLNVSQISHVFAFQPSCVLGSGSILSKEIKLSGLKPQTWHQE